MPDFIVFSVHNPGESHPWLYAMLNGELFGGCETYEDLLEDISKASLEDKELWVSKHHAVGVESSTRTDYPADKKMVAR